MMQIEITVPGKPMAKQRAGANHFSGTFYTKDKTANWCALAGYHAASLMKGAEPWRCPVVLRVTAYFEPAKSWPQWKQQAALEGRLKHTATPDFDNLEKSAADALKGIVWHDDAQVCAASIAKEYSTTPRTEIIVFPANGVSSQITRRDQL